MKIVNPDYIAELKSIVRYSPFPRHMAMTLDHIEFDGADVSIDLAQCHLQPFGIVHGGVIATLIDTATFWSAFLRIDEDSGLVNIDLKLNYLLPVVEGTLTAKGTCMRYGRTISYSEASVFDENKRLIAHGTSTLMVLEGKGLKMRAGKFLEQG